MPTASRLSCPRRPGAARRPGGGCEAFRRALGAARADLREEGLRSEEVRALELDGRGARLHDGRALGGGPGGEGNRPLRHRERRPPRARARLRARARPGAEAARDRRLRVVEGRQAPAALHEYEESLAPQHARRLLGARAGNRPAPQARRGRPRILADVRQVLARRRPRGLRARQRSLGRGRRLGQGHAADLRRVGHDRQRDVRLGLRRGVRPARRVPLEPGRREHRLLALRHEQCREVFPHQRHRHDVPRS